MKSELQREYSENPHAGEAQEVEGDFGVVERGHFSTTTDLGETLPESVSPLESFQKNFVGIGRPGTDWGGK